MKNPISETQFSLEFLKIESGISIEIALRLVTVIAHDQQRNWTAVKKAGVLSFDFILSSAESEFNLVLSMNRYCNPR